MLWIHIAAGSAALLGALIAIVAPKGGATHRGAGKVFFWGMAGVFVTAVAMAAVSGNLFLLLIALFSFYLAFAGWRFAVNRAGVAKTLDWIAIGVMIAAGLGMGALAMVYARQDNPQWVTLAVFGALALALGAADALAYRAGAVRGAARLRRHLTNMMGGAIATITAVLVVNVEVEPAWALWIAPTIALTPLIVWWNLKLALQERRAARP